MSLTLRSCIFLEESGRATTLPSCVHVAHGSFGRVRTPRFHHKHRCLACSAAPASQVPGIGADLEQRFWPSSPAAVAVRLNGMARASTPFMSHLGIGVRHVPQRLLNEVVQTSMKWSTRGSIGVAPNIITVTSICHTISVWVSGLRQLLEAKEYTVPSGSPSCLTRGCFAVPSSKVVSQSRSLNDSSLCQRDGLGRF